MPNARRHIERLLKDNPELDNLRLMLRKPELPGRVTLMLSDKDGRIIKRCEMTLKEEFKSGHMNG